MFKDLKTLCTSADFFLYKTKWLILFLLQDIVLMAQVLEKLFLQKVAQMPPEVILFRIRHMWAEGQSKLF